MNRRMPVLIVLAASLALLCCAWQVADAFAAESRGHAVPASLLPRELKNVDVKDHFVPAGTKAVGVIQSVIAHVVVARRDLGQAYYAADGDRLFEQDVVFTLKDSKCRIKLANDDIITVGDNSRLAVNEMTGDRKTPEKKSVLELARGKAMFYAIRLLNHKSATMNVVSPTAVTGVRGTKFGIEVTVTNETAAAARPILLADASADWGRHLILAQAAPLPGVTTVVHGFEGTVVVTSTVDGRTQTVGAGQTLSTTPQGIGALIPTPPQVSQSFQSATNVPPPQGAGGAGGTSGGQTGGQSQGTAGGTGTTTATTTTSTETSPPLVDTSSVTQTQSTSQTEQAATQTDPVTDPKTNASGGHTGYFAGILTNLSTAGIQDVYVSRNRYDGDGSVWGRGLKNSLDYLRVEGGGKFGNPTLKWAELLGGTKSSGLLTVPVSSTIMGTYTDGYGGQYLEWGYATIPSFAVGTENYAVDNRAYYIFGQSTTSADLMSLTGTAIYSGDAFGTYWTSSGGVNMSGSFACDVNFATKAVSGFNLGVSGSNVSAGISGASGTIGSDAHFQLTGGTWSLNGTTPANTNAGGSLYGPSGSYIGGPWGMSTDNAAAAGIYKGIKSGGPY